MITVASVLRSGGDFTPEYVDRLRRGVWQHMSGARFVCLSDTDDVPCERIPLETDWPGYWAKLELFRPGLFDGKVLYLDLDTVITGSLQAVAAYPHTFTVATNWYHLDCINSAAMAWSGDWSFLFTGFSRSLMKHYPHATRRGGDQGYITDQLAANGRGVERFDDLFPGEFVSYKAHELWQRRNASVVLFHGRPRPHEVGWQV